MAASPQELSAPAQNQFAVRRPRLLGALVLGVFVLVWFGSITLRPLYKPDESRYAEIPREMVASGDWVTPRLNGFKYFEKPPLQYWATALAFKVFGVSDWAARLWTALTAVAGILAALALGNRLFRPPAGAIAAAIVASGPLYVLLGQISTLDMGVAFFLSAAVFSFVLAQREEAGATGRRRWMLAFWALCAAAVLSKGLIGIVLPLGTVALYALVRRDWGLVRRLELGRGALIFLAITVPWFVAVSLANDEFLHFFFVQEHWLRFTTPMHKRQQPVWYFAAVLAIGLWPWLLAALAAWLDSMREWSGTRFSPRLFLGLWALVVFAFFSASSSKLVPYILPMIPALGVLAGEFLARRQHRRLLIAQSLLLAAGGILLAIAAWRLVGPGNSAFHGLGAGYLPWLAAAAAIAVAAGAAGALLAFLGRTAAAIGCIALGALFALLVAFGGHREVAPAYSVSPLVASLPQPPSREARIFAVETYDHTMPWSLRRPVTMVVYKDELAQAVAWEPHKFISDLAAFAQAWSAEREAYAFVAVRDFERLRRELALPMEVVARGPRYVIVRKP